MGDTSQLRDTERTRLRWNDIRIVGPLLVVALMMAALVSPQFASTEQSIGTLISDDCRRVPVGTADAIGTASVNSADAVGDLVGPCCPRRIAFASAGAFILSPDQCCIDGGGLSSVIGGGAIPICPPPASPARDLVPPPAPIKGPIWLGATMSNVDNGSIVLMPPTMLGLFIGNNLVVVTNEKDDVVFHGTLNAHGKIVLSTGAVGGSGDYTMVTTIRTGAKYTEVISVETGLG